MTDTGPSFDAADAAASAAFDADTPAPDVAPEAPPAEETTPVVAPPEAGGAPDVSPGKIAQLNREAQAYRQRAQEWERASRGWHPEDRRVILQLLEMGATDPEAAANGFLQVAAQLQRARAEQAAQAQAEPPLTRSQLEQLWAERDEQQQVSTMAGQIEAEARALGYDPDLNLDGYVGFLAYARDRHNGDLQAAHAAQQAALEKIQAAAVEKYRKEKEAQAGQMGAPSPDGTPGSSAQAPPMDFDEADRRTRELLGS